MAPDRHRPGAFLSWSQARIHAVGHVFRGTGVGAAMLQLPIGALADRLPKRALFLGYAGALAASSLLIPLAIHHPVMWGLWALFGASAGGLFTLSLVFIEKRFRHNELVRTNAYVAPLWGAGCLAGPLIAGSGNQWLTGHALPLMMAVGAASLVILACRQSQWAARRRPRAVFPARYARLPRH